MIVPTITIIRKNWSKLEETSADLQPHFLVNTKFIILP